MSTEDWRRFAAGRADKHHNFTHIDWQPNHAATADIAEALGRALQ